MGKYITSCIRSSRISISLRIFQSFKAHRVEIRALLPQLTWETGRNSVVVEDPSWVSPIFSSIVVKVTAKVLFAKSKGNILKQVEDLRKELSQLRVAQVSGQGGANKLGQIRVVRKNIARALTIANNKKRTALKAAAAGKKYKSLDLRVKSTSYTLLLRDYNRVF